MVKPYQPMPHGITITTYNRGFVQQLTQNNADLEQTINNNNANIQTLNQARVNTEAQMNSIASMANYERSTRQTTALVEGVAGAAIANMGYATHSPFGVIAGSVLEADAIGTALTPGYYESTYNNYAYQISNITSQIEALFAHNQQCQGQIQTNENSINTINRFLTDLTVNGHALYQAQVANLLAFINDYEIHNLTQSYEVRLCLYTLKTQLEIISERGAPHNYAALNRLLWSALRIVGRFENQNESDQIVANALVAILEQMHFDENLTQITLDDNTILELPAPTDVQAIEVQFNIDEVAQYNAALDAFNALQLNTQPMALLVAHTINFEMQAHETLNNDYKFLTHTLRLHTYLAQPTEEHLTAVKAIDATVTDQNTAMARYLACADFASGHPRFQTLSIVMVVFGLVTIMAAAALLIATTCGIAAPLVAGFTTAAIACFSAGGAISIGGLGLGFFGRRQGLSRAMVDFTETLEPTNHIGV